MNTEIKMRRHHLSIAMIAATMTVGTTASHADFVKDSKVQLKLKNFYLDRQYQDDKSFKNWGSWSQAATLDMKSGYAEAGGLKLGIDVLAQGALRLDGRETNDWVLPYDQAKKEQKTSFGKLGATLKAKVSETELKAGELLPMSPVLFFDSSRQLLTTYTGAWLESKDLKDTKITVAYIDKVNPRYDNEDLDLSLFAPPRFDSSTAGTAKSEGMWIAGIDYQLNPEIGLSYWYADVQDIYLQQFAALNYKTSLTEKTKLTSHIRYFDNSNSGEERAGNIDNQALSTAVKVQHGMHTVGLSYQQMFGETPFPTLGGWVPQPYLDNWGVVTFTRPNEKSWGVNYSYDFADAGIQGLKATAVYFKGYDAEGPVKGSKFNSDEFDFIVNYTVPEGTLKGLGIQGMFIDANHEGRLDDFKEYRVATTYTYTF